MGWNPEKGGLRLDSLCNGCISIGYKFICQAKKYLHLAKLTPAVLNDLVKAVYVHAPDNSSGHRVQDVEISYNYIGILPATLLHDLQNGKTA